MDTRSKTLKDIDVMNISRENTMEMEIARVKYYCEQFLGHYLILDKQIFVIADRHGWVAAEIQSFHYR